MDKKKYIDNTKVVMFDLTYNNITFCYGRKAYSDTMKAYTGTSVKMCKDGVTVRLTKDTNIQYVVAVAKANKKRSMYGVKALIVHELSHLVSMIMVDTNIQDDEFRSHSIQWAYEMMIPWVDSLQK